MILYQSRRGNAFALIITLLVVMLVTLLVVAYLSMVHTERGASQNFNDHSSAQAVALGVLNRIMAEHAVPQINGKPLAPFTVDGTSANPSNLPTPDSVNDYFGTAGSISLGARTQLAPIYEIVPDDYTVFENIGLVHVSKPTTSGTGAPAYDADYWAYDGLTPSVLGATVPNPPEPAAGNIPQWVDYYENDPATGMRKPYPTAEIAYAIWDEGGKLDVNMAGEDKSINGVAPHNLQLERALTTGSGQAQNLLNYLDNASPGDGLRERNNFSLRVIAPSSGSNASLNDTGDDRWAFSVRELVEKKLIDLTKLRQITTMSRDFDVRPEWDGDRRSLAMRTAEGVIGKFGAEDYLRSYINNPDLFDLFFNANSAVDPDKMVGDTLNNASLLAQLERVYPGLGAGQQQNWMQIMRFLAILRRALPVGPATGENSNVDLAHWSNYDVWGIALNAMQATAPPADHNLFASKGSTGYTDPDSREGIRISPFITAMSLKVKRIIPTSAATMDSPTFSATEYITVWNPYPYVETKIDGASPISYRVGSFTTGNVSGGDMKVDRTYLPTPIRDTWPYLECGLHHPSVDTVREPNPSPTNDSWVNMPTALAPGHFYYIRLPTRLITPNMMKAQNSLAPNMLKITDSNNIPGFLVTERAYIRNPDYYGLWDYLASNAPNGVETVYYSVSMTMPFWDSASTGDPWRAWAYIPPSQMPAKPGQVTWYSFQIDDPRTGALPRLVQPSSFLVDSNISQTGTSYRYSWWGYLGQHSIDFNQLKAQPDYAGVSNDPQSDFTPYYKGKSFTVNGSSVAGYNTNFGVNWPGASSTLGIASGDQSDFDLMMATFALPGRPFLNVGELGNVFAERPWTTLGFANKISPLNNTITVAPDDYSASGTDAGNPPPRPSALLDYFTTVGTPTAAVNLNYRAPGPTVAGPATTSLAANVNQRYQEKEWLFDAVTGTNDLTSQSTEVATGNLRPIRGRINLNTASEAALLTLLRAPYRMPASIGLKDIAKGLNWTVTNVDSTAQSDYWVTIDDGLAGKFASFIAKSVSDPLSIRPLRTMSDLSRIYDVDAQDMQQILKQYPASIINAIFGRLAQFGTVRSQAYTIDMAVRTLHPEIEKKRLANPNIKSAVTSEVHMQAQVYFDSFSRKSYVESIQYR